MGVPTMYIGLLAAARADERRPALRIAVSGGASLPVAVIDKFAEVFGADIYEGYGLVRDLAGRDLQPAGLRPQAGHRRPGDLGHRRRDRGRRGRGPDRAAAAG